MVRDHLEATCSVFDVNPYKALDYIRTRSTQKLPTLVT